MENICLFCDQDLTDLGMQVCPKCMPYKDTTQNDIVLALREWIQELNIAAKGGQINGYEGHLAT